MGGYVGSRAVNLSTTAADVSGNATIGGNLTVSGTTVTIDSANAQTVDLGDNDKIRLGDGDDLQIYHDGSASYVSDTGTGGLKLMGSDFVALQSATGENYVVGGANDATTVYHNNVAKLATTSTGVDVTGKLGTSANNNAGAKANYIRITDTDTSATAANQQGGIEFYASDSSAGAGVTASMEVVYAGSGGGGEITFNTAANSGAGVSEAMRIDESGNVGIGTSSPAVPLHIDMGTDNNALYIQSSDQFANIGLIDGTGSGKIIMDSGELAFTTGGDATTSFTGSSERMRIDSSGNVGIGTSSPNQLLHVAGSGNIAIKLDSTSTGGDSWRIFCNDNTSSQGGGSMAFYNEDTATYALNLQSSGNVGIGMIPDSAVKLSISGAVGPTNGSAGSPTHTFYSDADTGMYRAGANSLGFSTGGTEQMRLDASGNLLVGKTNTSFTVAGVRVRGDTVGIIEATSANSMLVLNRLTSDGDMATFYKDGTTVGSIGVNSSAVYYAGTTYGLRPYSAGIAPCNSSGAFSDNSADLGASSVRFDDIYATNGTIQTSDQNEKQQIASLTDAEMTAAKAISKLFKTFKWNDSVAENGDNARTHTGVVAQQVEQAMTDAGLNAGNYAFFISTTWWETQTDVPAVEADEENGIEAKEAYTRTDTYDTLEEAPEGATERNRKGIRYPELLSFIGAATEQRLTSIESRLTALEG